MPALFKYSQFCLILLYFTFLGLTPEPEGVLTENLSDKFLHFSGYLILIFSCDYAIRPNQQLFYKISLLFCYSLAIETCQHFIPNRGFSIGDLIANLAGLLFGGLLILGLRKRLNKNST